MSPAVSDYGALHGAGRFLIVVCIGVLVAFTSCSAGPTETRDDTFTVGASPSLVLSDTNGYVEVNAGPDNEVRVQATLVGADRLEYNVDQDGDTITLDVQKTGGWSLFRHDPEADITIHAPKRTDVDLDTSNGRINVRGIEGSGLLETSNGAINLTNVTGDYEARTSNGAIEVQGMTGTVTLRTSNGQVDLRGVKGEFDVETSNGRISFAGQMTAGGSNRLLTSNGDVVVELTGTPSFRLDAETSNGVVDSELPVVVTSKGEGRLIGTIGDGEASLLIRTSNGDVTIR